MGRRGQEGDGGQMNDEIGTTGVQLAGLSEDIVFLTRTVRAHLRTEISPLRAEFNVAPGEIGILRIIGANPGISQNDLAATVVLKKSAVAMVVRDLMERGLIARKQQKTDRRYNALTLTSKGRELVDVLADRVKSMHDDWFANFSPDERQQLFNGLNKLSARLSSRDIDLQGTDED